MDRLGGKVALVTGAARGIGAAIAQRLARDGAKVVIHYGVNEAAATRLAQKLGQGARAIHADLAKTDAIDALCRTIGEDVGGIDILVNNAGVGHVASLADTRIEQLDNLYAVNMRAVFYLTQQMLPLVRDGGSIVNISSTTVSGRGSGLSAYAGSKAAAEVFARHWAVELAPRNIRVNAVAPGLTDTDMAAQLPPAAREAIKTAHPFGRIGAPSDIADAVCLIIGDDAGWITGQTITVNGGAA